MTTVDQIFEEFGEERFREEERLQLERLTGEENLVVSTGGGLPCHGNFPEGPGLGEGR